MHLLTRIRSRRPNWAVMAAVAICGLAGCAGTKAPEQAPAPTQAVMSTATAASSIAKVSGKDIRLAQGPQAKGEMWVRVLKRWSEAEWRSDPIAVQRFLDIAEMGYPKLVRPGYARFSVVYAPVTYEAKSLEGLGLSSLEYDHVFEQSSDEEARAFFIHTEPSIGCISALDVTRAYGPAPERLPPSIVVPAPALAQPASTSMPSIPAGGNSAPIERGKLRYQLPQKADAGRILFTFDGSPCVSRLLVSFTRRTQP